MNSGMVKVKDGEWSKVRRNFQRIASTVLGPSASPTFAGLTLTGLTANSLIYPDSAKLLTSLGVAANGKIPIGSTGTTPVLAEITGTTNQVVSTSGAGSITLSLPQDIHTGASPTFAGGTFTGVVTGITPTAGTHLATKEYIDLTIGSVLDFFLSDTPDGVVANTSVMYEKETGEVQSTDTTAALAQAPDQLIFAYLSEAGRPAASHAREGVYDMHIHLNKSGTKSVGVYWTLSYVDANGSSNEVLIVTSEVSPSLTTDELAYDIHAVLANDITTGATKRLLLQVYANVTSSGSPTAVTVTMEGFTDSHLTVEVPSDVWQLRGDVLDDLNILGAVVSDGQFLVGTGSGVFAYESGATLRTSIGVGTGDSLTLTGLTLSGITQGSVLFAGVSGILSQDNDKLFWDNTNKRLGIGTATPQRGLHIQGTNPTIRMSDSDAATDQTVTTLVEFYRANNTNRVGFLGMESTANNILKIGTDYAAGQIVLATGSNVNALTIDSSGNIPLVTVAAEGSDVDKFLVSSTGVVKYRTGTQVLSDIGASASGHNHDATYQPLDDILTDLAALTAVADNEFIVGTGAGTYAHESGATARTSMGVGAGTRCCKRSRVGRNRARKDKSYRGRNTAANKFWIIWYYNCLKHTRSSRKSSEPFQTETGGYITAKD